MKNLTAVVIASLMLCACGRTSITPPVLESVSPTWAKNDQPAMIQITGRDVGAFDVPRVFIGWQELGGVSCDSGDTVMAQVPPSMEPGIWRLHLVMPDDSIALGTLNFTVFPADYRP